MESKVCTKCNETKSVSEFALKKGGRLGVAATCKACMNIVNAKWREDNATYFKEYREANPESIAKQKAAWKIANREHCNKKNREWARANPEKLRGNKQ